MTAGPKLVLWYFEGSSSLQSRLDPIDKHFEHVYYNSNDPNNKIGSGMYSAASFQV